MVNHNFKFRWVILICAALAALALLAACQPSAPAAPSDKVTIYLFWGDGCPHCAAEKPFLDEMKNKYPGKVEIAAYEVWSSAANAKMMEKMATAYNFKPSGVPTTFIGDRYWVGYSETTTRAEMETAIAACVQKGCKDAGAGIIR